MSIRKMWWRQVDGVVVHEEGENFGDDMWYFVPEGHTEQLDEDDPRCSHVDELFRTEQGATEAAVECLEIETTELERKKVELDRKIKIMVSNLKGLNTKD